MTDEDYERWSVDIIFRILPKAVIVSAVTGLAVVQFSGSYGKAIGIGLIALFMSLFRTWQRFLEPICAITFIVTVVIICTEPSTLAKFQTLVLAFASNHSQ